MLVEKNIIKEKFFKVTCYREKEEKNNKIFYIKGYSMDSIEAAKIIASYILNCDENSITFELLFNIIESVDEIYFFNKSK